MPSMPLGTRLPSVFVYIRARSHLPSYVLAARRSLAWYVQDNRVLIEAVFLDVDSADADAARPEFEAMCDTITRKRPYGVLVLHPGDLSADGATAERLASQVRATGVELWTVRGVLPATIAGGS